MPGIYKEASLYTKEKPLGISMELVNKQNYLLAKKSLTASLWIITSL